MEASTTTSEVGRAVCDLHGQVCVASSDGPPAAYDAASVPDVIESCQAASGCFQCTATTDQEIRSACTDSLCIPFDNARLTNLNLDGTLKPLP